MEAKYKVADDEFTRLENIFSYHSPKPGQNERYEFLRNQAFILALNISQQCPPGRERALALTKLEEAIFAANAAIARGE